MARKIKLTPAEAEAFKRGKGTVTIVTAAGLLGTTEDEVEACLAIADGCDDPVVVATRRRLLGTPANYCILCGNEKTHAKDAIGDACRVIVTSAPMDRAMTFWREQNERSSRCCGGLSTGKDHLFFHSKHWDCSYPPQPEGKANKDGTKRRPTKKQVKGWEEFHVGVEMGVSFYPEGARTYYLRDFDSYCDSEQYGGLIAYPASVTKEAFWTALDEQLNQAAEAAFNADLLSCSKCSYHYVSSAGCGCNESDDSE